MHERSRSAAVLASLILGSCVTSEAANTEAATGDASTLDIGAMIQPLGEEGVFKVPGFHTWGPQITRGEDDRYYLVYSRWAKEGGDWLTTSEIALAVADDIGGILIIAIFYTESLDIGWLIAAFVFLAAWTTLRRARAAGRRAGPRCWIRGGARASLGGRCTRPARGPCTGIVAGSQEPPGFSPIGTDPSAPRTDAPLL